MARPTVAQLRPVANPILTNMLVAFMNDDMDFVARQAAPVVQVNEESGTYFELSKKHIFADRLERRAYGDTYARTGWELTSGTYVTLQWGIEHPIPDEHRATSQVPLGLEQLALQHIAAQSNIRKERAFAADFMTTSVWGTDNTSANDWDNATTGKPITDVLTAKRTVKQATGANANAMIMGEIVLDGLLVNDQILERFKYTQGMDDATTRGVLASVFGVDYFLVSRAVYNTANEGQTASLSPIVDDDCLVCIISPGVDMMGLSSLKTFTWQPGGGVGVADSYYSEETDSTIVQHKEQWDQKLISSVSGYFFSDIV